MTLQVLIDDLKRRGIRLIPDPPKLTVEPASKLTDADREAIRAHKTELLDLLRAERAGAVSPDDRAAWTRSTVPDSRTPIIPPEIRTKIETIEAEARRLGWPPELLWNSGLWDLPRGLAAVLDPEDEIAEVTPDFIAILKTKRDLLHFRRRNA